MDIAFDLPSLLVLRRDETLSRGAKVVYQSNVPKDQTRLPGDVGQELLLRRSERVTR